MEPLKRIAYTDPPITGSTRTGSTARAESLVDQEDYFERLHRAHGAGFHGWGVGDGLQVAAEIGAADLRVKPGAALDAQGRLIVLAADGWAVIDPNADPNAVENIDTVAVTAQGVVLPTADLASGTYRVTIQFRETYSTGASGNLHHLLHTPWLLMQPVASLPPDDGSVLVLAEVSIDDSANVSALSAGQRRLAGLPAGSLALRRPANASDATAASVSQAGAAVLSPRADGGLDISTSQPGSPETMVPRLSIDAAGNVAIGPDGNQANLHVSGDLQLDGDADLDKKLTVDGDTELHGKLTVDGDADLRGNLTVVDVAVTGKVDGRDVSVDGSTLDTHVADLNAHDLAARLTRYLPLAGGAMSGDLTVANIVVTGKVDGRDVSADGSKLDTHLADTSTTAHGIATHLAKYLPLTGGSVTGPLTVTDITITGKVDGRDVSADGSKLDTHVADTSTNAHGIATHLAKYLPLTGGTVSTYLNVISANATAIRATSNAAGSYTAYGLGRDGLDCQWAVAAVPGQFANDAAPGDVVLRTERTSQRLILNSGVGASTLVVSNGKVGIGMTPFALPPKLTVCGIDATVNIETSEVMRLLRPSVPNVKNHNTAGLLVGSFETGISGRTRLDLAVSGPPNQGNHWGSVPDVTVMSLLANGNVGIGTTIPGAKLEINDGDLLFKARAGAEDLGDIIFQNAGGTQKGRIWSNPAAGAGLCLSSGDNTPDIAIDASGRVGIGTTDPKAKLEVAGHIASASGNRFVELWYDNAIIAHNAADLRIGHASDLAATGWSEKMRITPAGNVGIGTAGPEKKLHVVGSVKISNRLGVNGYDADSVPTGIFGGLSCWDVIYYGGMYNRSTIREKENLRPMSDVLDRIEQLNPVLFDRVRVGTPSASHVGFIAEEMGLVFPECVIPDDTSDASFFAWGINESALHGIAIAGVRELSYKLKALKQGLSVSRTGNVAIGSDSVLPDRKLYVAGDVRLDCSTSDTASAGAAVLPDHPEGFMVLDINGTSYKIPYYRR